MGGGKMTAGATTLDIAVVGGGVALVLLACLRVRQYLSRPAARAMLAEAREGVREAVRPVEDLDGSAHWSSARPTPRPRGGGGSAPPRAAHNIEMGGRAAEREAEREPDSEGEEMALAAARTRRARQSGREKLLGCSARSN